MKIIHSIKLIIATTTLLACIPAEAGHGSNIAAGFMGAGFGMMAGMALADHHHSNHCHHNCYYHEPVRERYVVYSDYARPSYCSYNYHPYEEVHIYEHARPSHHHIYECSPRTNIYISNHHCRPCHHSSFSFGFSL